MFEVFEGADRQWYWRLRAANGEIAAQSEGYTRRPDAARAALELPAMAARAGYQPGANDPDRARDKPGEGG
jgi:uncharacterized protein YegP (UPF0339 family)